MFLAGLPVPGKTTLPYALAHHLHWPVIEKDVLHSALLEHGIHPAQAGPRAYHLALTLLQEVIVQQQQSLILDRAGRQPWILERATAIAQAGTARHKIIRSIAPDHLRTARLAARRARPSQWRANQASDQQQADWYRHIPPSALILTTTQPVAHLVARALAFIHDERAATEA